MPSDPPAQPTQPQDLPLGPRYRVVSLLGSGGMADVYLAQDRESGHLRAVKVLRAEYAARQDVRIRFGNEARIMSRLQHRHVLRVFEVGTVLERPFIVMELAEGGSLADWCERHGPMPPVLACTVLIQACKGLGAAHKVGVVHRDIKPGNVLLTRRGVCRVTDFGISRSEGDTGLTRTGVALGTLGFVPPEQFEDASSVTASADIYALGACLVALLTLRQPGSLFLADREPALLDGVPPQLHALVIQATRYKAVDRTPSTQTLALQLHQARATLPPDPVDTPPLVAPGPAALQRFSAATRHLSQPPVWSDTSMTPASTLQPLAQLSRPATLRAPPQASSKGPTPQPAPEPVAAEQGSEAGTSDPRARWLLLLAVALGVAGVAAAWLL